MGKALRAEHLSFFKARMMEHDKVTQLEPIPDEDEYLFKVTRRLGRKENHLTVHLADTYRYGLADMYSRPDKVGRGSYVVLGMPHASADGQAIEEARQYKIGLGHIGKFMGALNYTKVWEYMTPRERQEQAELEEVDWD